MIKPEATIFKKVAVSEKKNLFREIISEQSQLLIKSSSQDILFHLLPVQIEGDEILLCQKTADSQNIQSESSVIVSFNLESERYYFNTDLVVKSGWIVLSIQGELYQLHRRAHARLIIPDSYDAAFVLTQIHDQRQAIFCTVKDISAGGLKIQFGGELPLPKIGDRIKGMLRLRKTRPLDLEAEVRFVHKAAGGNEITQTVGIQFMNLDRIAETRLLSMIIDLQWDLYKNT